MDVAGKFKPFGATPETPEYDLGKVTVPTAAFYADNDLLSDPAVSIFDGGRLADGGPPDDVIVIDCRTVPHASQDVQQLFDKVPMKLGKFRVALPSFNHLDFLWGKSAKKLVFDDVLAVLARFGPETMRNRSMAVLAYYRMLLQQSGRRIGPAPHPTRPWPSSESSSTPLQPFSEEATEASSEAPSAEATETSSEFL